jgi:hypothetical protein
VVVSCDDIPAPTPVLAVGGCNLPTVTGLVMRHDFEHVEAGRAADAGTLGNHAVLHGQPLVVAGRPGLGQALAFDAVDDYLRIARAPCFHLTNFTLTAWIMAGNQAMQGRILAQDDLTNRWGLAKTGDGLDVMSTLDGDFSTASVMLDGHWQFVAAVRDTQAGQLRWYVDGLLANWVAITNDAGYRIETDDVFIGRPWPFHYPHFQGLMDEVRVYNRALNAQEIEAVLQVTNEVQVTLTEVVDPGCPKTITRVWSTADSCGASLAATQVITVVDTVAPILLGVPPDFILSCQEPIPAPAPVVAYDPCGAYSNALPVAFQQIGDTNCGGVFRRIWSAMDACGNAVAATQLVTMAAPPAITLVGVPSNITVTCGPVPPAATVTTTGGCAAVTVTSGLVLRLSFDGDAATVVDTSGWGHHAERVGGTQVATGRMGGALRFGGTDYLRITNRSSLNVTSASMSVACWLRPDGTGVMRHASAFLLDKTGGGGGPQGQYVLFYDDTRWAGGLSYAVGRSLAQHARSVARDVVTNAQWRHVVTTWTGTNIQFMVDGRLWTAVDVFRADPGGIGPNNFDLLIGCSQTTNPGPQYWQGYLDDLRVYDRALGTGDVHALMTSVSPAVAFHETRTGSCPEIITRTWSAVDACGRTSTASQVITVADTNAPHAGGRARADRPLLWRTPAAPARGHGERFLLGGRHGRGAGSRRRGLLGRGPAHLDGHGPLRKHPTGDADHLVHRCTRAPADRGAW